MRIKEAAEKSGLTEKAIRLYEEKGLISPTITEIAGRKFRDYDDNTVATLTTIAGLRRSFFSLEQIAAMQDSPERIPEIFATYRDELKEQYNRLGVLIGKADEILASTTALSDETGLVTPEPLRDATALSLAMTAVTPVAIEQDIPHLVGKREEPILHFKKWDEELTADQRETVYRQYLAYYTRWEKRYDTELIWWNLVDWCKKRKRLLLGLALVCVAVLFLTFTGLYLPYQVEMDGYKLVYAESPETAEEAATEAVPVTLRMKGKKLYRLFHHARFMGTLDIDGYRTYYYAWNRWQSDPTKELDFRFDYAALTDLRYEIDWFDSLSGEWAILKLDEADRRDMYDNDSRIYYVATKPFVKAYCFVGTEADGDTCYLVFPAESEREARTTICDEYTLPSFRWSGWRERGESA